MLRGKILNAQNQLFMIEAMTSIDKYLTNDLKYL